MTEVNVPLLRKAVEWVETQDQLPDIDREWWQGVYVCPPISKAMFLLGEFVHNRKHYAQVAAHCGSAYCVAGYIGQMLDQRYASNDHVDGVHVSELAREALGLTEEQAGQLFAGSNTAPTIRLLAETFAGEAL
jgi:hypothetical protein